MKNVFLLILGIIAVIQLNAQTPPAGTPCMKLDVKTGESIIMDMALYNAGTLYIDPGDGTYETKEFPNNNWIGDFSVIAKGEYIRLYGDIWKFYSTNNWSKLTAIDPTQMNNLNWLEIDGNNISSLDVSNNRKLVKLYFDFNQVPSFHLDDYPSLQKFTCRHNNLTSLTLNNTPSLYHIYCDGNLLSACGLDSLYTSLNNSTGLLDERNVFVQVSAYNYTPGSNPGVLTSNTEIATNKGWHVRDFTDNGITSIAGDGTGCDLTNVKEVSKSISFRISPNPTSGLINIESHELIKEVEILNSTAQIVGNYKKLNTDVIDINLSNNPAGVYLIKVITTKGFGIQKVIVEK